MKTIKLRTFHDQRGFLSENTKKQVMLDSRHFFVSKSKPGVVRGNHYHRFKSEWFYVIQGTCQVITENIKTKKREIKTVKDTDHLLVHMPPLHAHAFKNIGRNQMILLALINNVLDHKHPDTYQYFLL